MPVVVGIYDTQSEAERAYVRLRAAGYAEDHLTLVAAGTMYRAPQTAAELAASRNHAEKPAHSVSVAHPVNPAVDRVPDHAASAGVTPPMENAEPRVEGAAIGTAVGVLAGAGMAGPLGAVVGGAAGAGIGAWFAGLGASDDEVRSYQDAITAGRFLVAVETDEPTLELRTILDASGAEHVDVR